MKKDEATADVHVDRRRFDAILRRLVASPPTKKKTLKQQMGMRRINPSVKRSDLR